MKTQRSLFGLASFNLLVLHLIAGLTAAAQVQVIDDFTSGNTTVSSSIQSTFGDSVPGVLGGNRAILLTKENERSATSVKVDSGVLTWTQTGGRDEASVSYSAPLQNGESVSDWSGYDAVRISVISASPNAGKLEIDLSYFGAQDSIYGVSALATLPATGVVELPFLSFIAYAGFPPVDFTKIHSIGLTFRGTLLATGIYVFDDLEIESRSKALPNIVVEQPVGTRLISGSSSVDFGTAFPGRISERAFVVRNTGTVELSGIGITVSGPDASEFRVVAAPAASVLPGGDSVGFTLAFAPVTAGQKNATLHVRSNDPDEPTLDINLVGIGVSTEAPLENWNWQSPLPEVDGFGFIVHDGTRFIALGRNVSVSSDGGSWHTIGGSSPQFYSVAAGNGRLVGVEYNGALFMSTNGIGWTGIANAPDQMWSVAYGNGIFVAVGNGGIVATSTDASSWDVKQFEIADFGKFRSVVFGNGVFAAAALRSGLFSLGPNGNSANLVLENGLFNTIVFARDRFFASEDTGSGNNGRFITTVDLSSYYAGVSDSAFGGTTPGLPFVAFGEGVYVVAGQYLYTSTTGAGDWTQRKSSLSYHFGIIYHNGVFATIAPSSNLMTWAPHGVPSAPAMSVTAASGQVQLSWPTGSTNYALQWNGAIAGGSWATVTNAPSFKGSLSTVTLSTKAKKAQFFRLRAQ